MTNNKLAIVYDWIDSWGGAERLLSIFASTFPEADWFTLVHDRKTASWAKGLDVHTSFMQGFPSFLRHNRSLTLPFMPYAVESFNLSGYSHVLSVTSAFSKAIITRPETKHVSYILSPPRFLWSHQKEYGTASLIVKPYINYLKNWDYIAARRPDKLIAISSEIAARIKKYYNLESEVIMPPFDTMYWSDLKPNKDIEHDQDKPYLLVSRLVHYKRVDLVVDAFKHMPSRKLIIVGDGKLYSSLRSSATPNIIFMQNLGDKELAELYFSSKALLMPQREDFGYVALEAQACGCPVIAFKRGGASTTVLDNETGVLFESQTVDSLRKALDKFEEIEYAIRRSLDEKANQHLAQFSSTTFIKKFTTLLT